MKTVDMRDLLDRINENSRLEAEQSEVAATANEEAFIPNEVEVDEEEATEEVEEVNEIDELKSRLARLEAKLGL